MGIVAWVGAAIQNLVISLFSPVPAHHAIFRQGSQQKRFPRLRVFLAYQAAVTPESIQVIRPLPVEIDGLPAATPGG